MWDKLDTDKKNRYKSLITNFASLSEAFSQKVEEENSDKISEIVAPIINSKFQETAFQRVFDAVGEDISNTSFDASLQIDDNHKYLIGIKSFGVHSGDQKIAQFKSSSVSEGWSVILGEAKGNADELSDKSLADNKNEPLYKEVANRIAELRNERIYSSKEQIKGFDVSKEVDIKAIYHVLMPSKKGEKPEIHVGETSYLPIDINNIKILGSTGLKNSANFKFTDGHHTYKYTDADSQLYMNFNNKEIIIETWDVNYVMDAFSFFENLDKDIRTLPKKEKLGTSVSWMIANSEGEVEESSGFNGFDGASKLSRSNNYREKRIESFEQKYKEILSNEDLSFVILYLKKVLLEEYSTKDDKRKRKLIRSELRDKIIEIGNEEIKKDVFAMIYRPASEMYIPIPESRKFHELYPDFFGRSIGTFIEGTGKLALEKENRQFKLEFLPSGNKIISYINQDNGKSIQSVDKQDILGEWILRGVFQLKEYEPLTGKRLNELGINAIRLIKFDDVERGIGLEFTWIDVNNPPEDSIGWVAKKK